MRGSPSAPPHGRTLNSAGGAQSRRRAPASAATAAPPDMPRTYGSASGLRSSACSSAPDSASECTDRKRRPARAARAALARCPFPLVSHRPVDRSRATASSDQRHVRRCRPRAPRPGRQQPLRSGRAAPSRRRGSVRAWLSMRRSAPTIKVRGSRVVAADRLVAPHRTGFRRGRAASGRRSTRSTSATQPRRACSCASSHALERVDVEVVARTDHRQTSAPALHDPECVGSPRR